MSTIVSPSLPKISPPPHGFRAAMLAPGMLVTFLLVIFALALVLFLSLRFNDGSLLGAGFTLANFATILTDRSMSRSRCAPSSSPVW